MLQFDSTYSIYCITELVAYIIMALKIINASAKCEDVLSMCDMHAIPFFSGTVVYGFVYLNTE